MMVCFDDETTTMQVRAPFLECVDYGEKLPFMHRIIIFGTGEFPRYKSDWVGSMLAFLLQYCADSNVTRVARYDVRFRRIRQLQHWVAFDCILEVLKRNILSSPPHSNGTPFLVSSDNGADMRAKSRMNRR
jgi:hypothetical protein